jgi:hypothetical protein
MDYAACGDWHIGCSYPRRFPDYLMSFALVNTGGNVIEASGGTGTLTALVAAVARIRYISASASAGDECKVTDTAGNIVFDSFATGADFSDEVELSKVPPINGLKLATLTSGQVYVYLR